MSEVTCAKAPILPAVRHWIEQAVIGLNLCPFARAVYVRERIRFVVSDAHTEDALRAELDLELHRLHQTPAEITDTTLLIHPWVLEDFRAFNEFLGVAEEAVRSAGLEGEIQIASFHPQYQFAGTESDDITNFTNRAPYPILHLLREASVARALESYPDAHSIFEANIRTMQALGHAGWTRLMATPPPP